MLGRIGRWLYGVRPVGAVDQEALEYWWYSYEPIEDEE